MKLTALSQTLLASILGVTLSACNSDKSPVIKASDKQVTTATQGNGSQKKISTARDLPHYLTRDVQDDVFYFVLPDRFHNGDSSNDNGSSTIKLSQGGFDKTKSTAYHGGDLAGLKEKIPYLNEMGISAIWLTPIMRNQAIQGDVTGYHGYWVLDFTEIDPHLGTNAELKSLIDTAHDNNIKVFFDIITNHSADVIRYKECHGDGNVALSDGEQQCAYKSLAQVATGDKYTPFLPQGMEDVKSPAWLNDPKYYHNQGDSTFSGENSLNGDFFGLDDINTDDPAVVAGFTELFKELISEFKPDGFRIDTMKHVNIEFWQDFAPALLEHAHTQGLPKFFMFGEVFDGNSDVLSKFTTTGKVQSVLDFGFQFAVRDVLIKQLGTNKLAELFANDHKYNDDDSNANQLLNFIGNHDLGRFATELNDSEHHYNDNEKLSRLTLAHSMMYFLRGIPVVYYGSEQGFVGDGGNHDSRQDMMPSMVASYNNDDLIGTNKTTANDNFDQSHPLYQALAEFAQVYYRHAPLRFGQQKVIYASDSAELLAVTRTTDSEQYLVLYNTANEKIDISFELTGTLNTPVYDSGNSVVVINDGKASVNMTPLSFAVYRL